MKYLFILKFVIRVMGLFVRRRSKVGTVLSTILQFTNLMGREEDLKRTRDSIEARARELESRKIPGTRVKGDEDGEKETLYV